MIGCLVRHPRDLSIGGGGEEGFRLGGGPVGEFFLILEILIHTSNDKMDHLLNWVA